MSRIRFIQRYHRIFFEAGSKEIRSTERPQAALKIFRTFDAPELNVLLSADSGDIFCVLAHLLFRPKCEISKLLCPADRA